MSLTFDDARPSQVDVGMPVLDRHGIPATFYVTPSLMAKRPGAWREVADRGHEIGNHTDSHPCTCNYNWSRSNALEDYTLERMEQELDSADRKIEDETGVKPRTFAYPCGQTYVGRGEAHQSYVPLIARRFIAGRACNKGLMTDPAVCDLAHLYAVMIDGVQTFAEVKTHVDEAIRVGAWLIFVGHEILPEAGRLTTSAPILDQVCAYAIERRAELFTGTMATVAEHLSTRAR